MLIIKMDAQDMLISAEVAMTEQEVCPICGKPSQSENTKLCDECFWRFINEADGDNLTAWINREISIRESFPKQFV